MGHYTWSETLSIMSGICFSPTRQKRTPDIVYSRGKFADFQAPWYHHLFSPGVWTHGIFLQVRLQLGKMVQLRVAPTQASVTIIRFPSPNEIRNPDQISNAHHGNKRACCPCRLDEKMQSVSFLRTYFGSWPLKLVNCLRMQYSVSRITQWHLAFSFNSHLNSKYILAPAVPNSIFNHRWRWPW